MQKINFASILVVILIGFNAFSQTVKDVDNIRLEINMKLVDNDADLIRIGDIEPDFRDVGYYQTGSEIVRINSNVKTFVISKGTPEESVLSSDLNFYYQNDELIFVEMKEKIETKGKLTHNGTITHLYFSNGKLLAAQEAITMYEYEKIYDPSKLEQKYKFVERAIFLLDKIKNSK